MTKSWKLHIKNKFSCSLNLAITRLYPVLAIASSFICNSYLLAQSHHNHSMLGALFVWYNAHRRLCSCQKNFAIYLGIKYGHALSNTPIRTWFFSLFVQIIAPDRIGVPPLTFIPKNLGLESLPFSATPAFVAKPALWPTHPAKALVSWKKPLTNDCRR